LGKELKRVFPTISNVNIKQLCQNIFIIYPKEITLLWNFFIGFSIICCIISPILVLKNDFEFHYFFIFLIIGVFTIIYGIKGFFDTRYKLDLVLGDNYIILNRKAMCCRKKTQNYQNNDLKEIKLECKSTKISDKDMTFYSYKHEMEFILKNGKTERIFYVLHDQKLFNDEEVKYLLDIVNNHIKKSNANN